MPRFVPIVGTIKPILGTVKAAPLDPPGLSTGKTFMTSSPRWLITLTAMRPDFGLLKAREVSLWRVAHASSLISGVERRLEGALHARSATFDGPVPASSTKHPLEMPSQLDGIRSLTCTRRQRDAAAVKGVVRTTIGEVLSQPTAHYEPVIRIDTDVTLVEQPMEITPQEKTIRHIARATLGERSDVAGLQDRE